ncbi:MAG: hypothetical protein QXW62_05450 [Candidatus Methanomethylicaceae archaeon]|nr:ferritin-like domain-containing protein [Candidatus Verstraetearchaeota archaeon]
MNKEDFLECANTEERYSKELRELANSIKHSIIRALIEIVSMDSEKHSMLYKSIMKLITDVPPFISEDDLKRISSEIDRHIKLERQMIDKTKELIDKTEDIRIKLLLSAIIDDEFKHHKLLMSIRKRIIEPETLTESVLWDMVWKDSPWHGTPGG